MLIQGSTLSWGPGGWGVDNVESHEQLAGLEWRGNPGHGEGWDEAVGYRVRLQSVTNLIQTNARGNWEPLPSSQGGKCYDSNYSNERWFIWLYVEPRRAGRACGEKRQVEPSATQYPWDCARGDIIPWLCLCWFLGWELSSSCSHSLSSLPDNLRQPQCHYEESQSLWSFQDGYYWYHPTSPILTLWSVLWSNPHCNPMQEEGFITHLCQDKKMSLSEEKQFSQHSPATHWPGHNLDPICLIQFLSSHVTCLDSYIFSPN